MLSPRLLYPPALLAFLTLLAALAPAAQAQEVSGELKRYHPVAVTFDGPTRSENAATFTNHRFNLNVTAPDGTELTIPGFFAADGNAANTSATSGNKWRAYVLPLQTGTYAFEASFRTGTGVAVSLDANAGSPAAFDGQTGSFTVAETNKSGDDNRARGLLRYVGKHYPQFSNGAYFLKSGPDSPENLFAYEDFDGTPEGRGYDPHLQDWTGGDPTWKNGKGKGLIGALNYLARDEGMNSFSFIPMNVQGDGDDTWPWTGKNNRQTYDVSKLAQWEIVFSHADALGMFIHFKTQETENDQLLDGGALGNTRKLYYRELIARFAHHHALNWNLGEENTNTDAQRKAFASYFHALDPYDHPVVVHTYPGQKASVYNPLLGYNDFEGPSIQLSGMSDSQASDAVRTWRESSADAGRPWLVSVDEPGNAGDGVYSGNYDDAREVLYASYLSGAYGTEWYFGYSHPDDDLDLDDFRSRDAWWDYVRIGRETLEELPFTEMEPLDDFLQSGDGYAFGQAGQVYAVYLKDGSGAVDGSFDVEWINPRTGDRQTTTTNGPLDAPFSEDALAILTPTDGGGPAITSLTLVNADTDEDLGPLEDGDVLDFAALPTTNLSVRANANGATSSVRFGYDGDDNYQTENNAPYAIQGDSPNGDYNPWTPSLGAHTLTATPFAQDGAQGEAGPALTISFTVVEDDGGGDGGEVVFAVNAGGNAYTAPDGTAYEADDGFSGGRTYSTNDAIAGTEADALYQSERYGNFSYDVPLEDGTYEVTLRFAEVYWNASGKRVFDVIIEGDEVVTDLDLYAEVGHDAAYDVTETVSVSDGTLNIVFDTDVNNAKVGAVLVASTDGGGGGSCTSTEEEVISAEGLPLDFFGTPVGTQKTATLDLDLTDVESAAITVTADDIDQPEEASMAVNGAAVAVPAGAIEPDGQNGDLLTGTAPLDLALLEEGQNQVTFTFASDLGGTTSGYRITDLEVTLERCVEAAAQTLDPQAHERGGALPEAFALWGNYPNPFGQSTTIRYALPERSRVVLTVYDLLGRKVATLVDAERPAGVHTARWSAAGLPSGTYLYRLEAGRFAGARTMILVK